MTRKYHIITLLSNTDPEVIITILYASIGKYVALLKRKQKRIHYCSNQIKMIIECHNRMWYSMAIM